jgi:lipoate-protein ligase A
MSHGAPPTQAPVKRQGSGVNPKKGLSSFMIDMKEYDLQDNVLLTGGQDVSPIMVWVPEFVCIILGQSNSPESSLHQEEVLKDDIPVYKRPSGGETVILSPNTLVISILKRNIPLRSPKRYFETFNEKIIDALHNLGVQGLRKRGISDICIGDKKILGSSIYRNKDLLLYHAVLNVSESMDRMERYLKHPVREPDYRRRRSHRMFVTSLALQGYNLSPESIKQSIFKTFND